MRAKSKPAYTADGAEEDVGWAQNREEGRLIYRDDTVGLSEGWVQDRGYTVKPHPPDRQGWVSYRGAQNQTIQLSCFIARCLYFRFPEVNAVFLLFSFLFRHFFKYQND